MEQYEIQCPYCKSTISADATKCRYCGEFLVNNPNPPHQNGSENRDWRTEQWKRPAEERPTASQPLYVDQRTIDQRPRPKNHLVGAILVTIFCCQIFGIVSIVFAAQVDSTYNRGDIEESYRLSNKAQTWFNVALITGLSVGLIYGVLAMLGILSEAMLFY